MKNTAVNKHYIEMHKKMRALSSYNDTTVVAVAVPSAWPFSFPRHMSIALPAFAFALLNFLEKIKSHRELLTTYVLPFTKKTLCYHYHNNY